MAPSNILVVGAGELGFAIVEGLAKHPQRSDARISVMLRPESIKTKPETVSRIRALGADAVEPVDILNEPVKQVADTFRKYDTIVQCAGFGMPAGTQLKVARAALDAGVAKFVPWQFGVDYETIGRGSVMELFDEHLDVRDLLRAQDKTDWLVVSTGLFTSFYFLPGWGTVDAQNGVLRAFGSWDVRISLTTPRDVGRMTAEALFVPPPPGDKIVYVAGDTLSYMQIADIVEAAAPTKAWKRELWDLPTLHMRLEKNGGDMMTKYQIMFGGDKGLDWDLERTLNFQRGIPMTSVKGYIKENPQLLVG